MDIFPDDMTVEDYQELIEKLMASRNEELKHIAQWQQRQTAKIENALAIVESMPADDFTRIALRSALTDA